ncbi:MAG TPA: hypothetical protein EYQ39_04980, partial [Gemmatimonadetes bacterium]|nr:hypothetical protein [Gemmatimonadota bacterium]
MPEKVIEQKVEFSAFQRQVWQAITDPEKIAKWFGDEAEIDLKANGDGVMSWKDYLPRFGKRDETLEEQRVRLEADYEAYQRALIQPQYRQATMRRGITGTEQQPSPAQLLTDGYTGVQAIASRAIANRVSDLEFRV